MNFMIDLEIADYDNLEIADYDNIFILHMTGPATRVFRVWEVPIGRRCTHISPTTLILLRRAIGHFLEGKTGHWNN